MDKGISGIYSNLAAQKAALTDDALLQELDKYARKLTARNVRSKILMAQEFMSAFCAIRLRVNKDKIEQHQAFTEFDKAFNNGWGQTIRAAVLAASSIAYRPNLQPVLDIVGHLYASNILPLPRSEGVGKRAHRLRLQTCEAA